MRRVGRGRGDKRDDEKKIGMTGKGLRIYEEKERGEENYEERKKGDKQDNELNIKMTGRRE